MSIGSSLGITLPTQGGNSGTWGTDLNAELQKIIDAVEGQVPASAIDFSADFDLNDNALTSVKAVSFEQQSSVATLNSLYWNTSGELIARDGSNNAIQITSLGGLNNAGAGGLGDSGGTYGTSGITFDWDGTRYNAKNGSGSDDYANVRMDQLQIRDGSSNDLTIAVPTMTSNYTVNLPAAVASGATTILQSDASGNCSWSNTFSTDITLTGSAVIKHGNYRLTVAGSAGQGWVTSTDAYVPPNTTDATWTAAGSACTYVVPIELKAGKTVQSIDVMYIPNGSVGVKTFAVKETSIATGSTADKGNTTDSGTGSSIVTVNVVTTPFTVGVNGAYHFVWTGPSGGETIMGVDVTYSE